MKLHISTHCIGGVGFAFVVLALVGCAAVPEQEFVAYTQAFDEAKAATEQLIVTLDLAKKIAREVDKGISETSNNQKIGAQDAPFSTTISLPEIATPKLDEITARREALEGVARFNAVLMVLAAGKKRKEVKSSMDSLAQGLSGIANLVGSTLDIPEMTTNLISTVVGKLQEAQNRAQFEAALRDAAPVIDGILELFRQDAADVYEIFAREAVGRSKRLQDKVFDLMLQMKSVSSEHETPNSELSTGFQDSNTKLRGLLNAVGLYEEAGHSSDLLTNGGKTFDKTTLSQLQQTLIQAETARDQYSAVIAKQKSLRELMESYGQLLLKTRQSLQVARAALDKPAEFRTQASELIMSVFEVKRNLDAMRLARSAADGG